MKLNGALTLTWLDKFVELHWETSKSSGTQWFWGKAVVSYRPTLLFNLMSKFLMVLDHDTTGLKVFFRVFSLYESFASRVFFWICDSRPALTCSAHRGKRQASVSSLLTGKMPWILLSQPGSTISPHSFASDLYSGCTIDAQNSHHWLKQIQGIKLRIALFPRSRGPPLHDAWCRPMCWAVQKVSKDYLKYAEQQRSEVHNESACSTLKLILFIEVWLCYPDVLVLM